LLIDFYNVYPYLFMKHTSQKHALLLICYLIGICCFPGLAQPTEKFIRINVTPEQANWTYKPGEKVRFIVSVTQSGLAVGGAKVHYAVMPEKMAPVSSGPLNLKDGKAIIDGGTMKTPGFLRCEVFAEVDGKEYKGLGTAAFDPGAIKPTVENPADFTTFWNDAKAELGKVPLDTRMTLLPERCTENVNVYQVNIQNFKNSRLYGILCVPKKEGKYPAILQVPGAGIRPYFGDIAKAEKGVITLQIGIHGIPVTMEKEVYDHLSAGALAGYPSFNLDNRELYYYKRVYLGCVRAVDFLHSLPQFDGTNLGVSGGSQGGALSIVTAALDTRVKSLVAYYPALSDMTGYLHGRAGGWPHMFTGNNAALHNKKDKIETIGYYDVVNFARQVKVPGYYSWGFNDEVCPPTSMYAVYNVITAPKEVWVVPETGHWTFPEQHEKTDQWLISQLKGGNRK
jgi:cephalosporin-C deacetylase-like acetyl esterase